MMNIMIGIILSFLTSMGVVIDTAGSCSVSSGDSSSAMLVPCLLPAPTDTEEDDDTDIVIGTGLIKVGGSGLVKVGGAG